MTQQPWMYPAPDPSRVTGSWWRVLVTGFLLYVASVVLLAVTGNPNLFPTVIMLGNFLVPITFVTFLYGRQHVSRLTLPTLALCFFYGGLIGVLGASFLEPLLMHRERFDFASAMGVGLIEEFAKIWAVVVLARRARHDSELDGLLLGAAVGMGFAALESTGYAFTAFLSSHGNVTAAVWITLVRALDAPLGHGTWTAILAAALFRESSPRRFRIDGPVLGAYLTVVVLHGLWDAFPRVVAFRVPLLGIHLFVGPTLVSVIGLALLARLWSDAISRQAQPAPGGPAPGIEGYGP